MLSFLQAASPQAPKSLLLTTKIVLISSVIGYLALVTVVFPELVYEPFRYATWLLRNGIVLGMPAWLALLITSTIRLFGALGIRRLKRWGIYLFFLSLVETAAVNIYARDLFAISIDTVIIVITLFLSVKHRHLFS